MRPGDIKAEIEVMAAGMSSSGRSLFIHGVEEKPGPGIVRTRQSVQG
jgi:hypothetical protein